MTAAASAWDVGRGHAGPAASVVCAATGETLAAGVACRSALVPNDAEDAAARGGSPFRRVDVSVAAWSAGHRPTGVFSHWLSRVPDPTQPRREPLDLAGLLDLLGRLCEDDAADRGRASFRFVLALLLMRRRMLRLDDTRSDPAGSTNWCFTRKEDPAKGPMGRWAEGDTLEVPDPVLSAEDAAAVAEQLHETLGVETP